MKKTSIWRELSSHLVGATITAVVTLIFGVLASRWILSRHDESVLIQTLIPEIVSDNAIRTDLALQLLKEELSPTRYERYNQIILRKLRQEASTVRLPLNENPVGSNLPETLKYKVAQQNQRKGKLQEYGAVRDEWRDAIQSETKARTEESKRKYEATFEKLVNSEPETSDLWRLAQKKLKSDDCVNAFLAAAYASAQTGKDIQSLYDLSTSCAKPEPIIIQYMFKHFDDGAKILNKLIVSEQKKIFSKTGRPNLSKAEALEQLMTKGSLISRIMDEHFEEQIRFER